MKQEYVKCHVPSGVDAWSSPTATSPSAKFRELLNLALTEKREPQALPKEVDKIAIDLASEIKALTARMDELRAKNLIADGVAPGRIAGMLVQAQLHYSTQADAPAPTPKAEHKPGLWQDQLKLHDEFMSLARQGAIAAVEAGTGTGKSRIIGACAHSLVALRNAGHSFPKHPHQTAHTRLPAFITDKVSTWHETEQRLRTTEGQKPPVVIAAPTIANLLHLLREFKSLDLPDVTHALLIGRQQFASAQAIAELLQEHPCPPVADWLQAGMPCGQSSNTAGIGITGLMDDLRTVASGLTFPCEDACLNAQSDDEESAEYNRLRNEAAAADIIFTTHAMLAMRSLALARGNTPQIAKPYAILIDEAHMIEDSFASMSGSSLAMSKLGSALKPEAWEGSGLKGKVQSCRDSWSNAYIALQALPEECPLPMPQSSGKSYKQWLTAKSKLKALNEDLNDFCNAASKKSKASQNVLLSYLMNCKRTLDMMLDEYSGRIEFSPSRRFPLVQMGVKSVTASLLYTWESAHVVGLFSGTLFTTNETIDGAINALAMDLAVPRARTHLTSRVHPSWLFDSATLYLPKPGSAPKVPKSPDLDDGSVNIWAEQSAKKILEITQTAKGGTLVLCTGYERAHAIANELRKLLPDTGVLIEQRPSSGVDGMARQVRALAASGKRPIAIATGGAWTGLDLSDSQVSPENDTLLTDLVISAIPFNTQRSYLHLQKVERLGMNVEISYALRKFTQGLGRLIRRPGVKNRRLWILDNRLESVRSATYSSRFLSALARYTRKSYY